MKNLLFCLAFLSLTAGSARAGLVLSTTNPPGTPLNMSAGSISGPMLMNVASDNPPNDVMSAWQVQLEIIPIAGATGTLVFNDPATSTPAHPPGYVFGANGLDLTANNLGTSLGAYDFYDTSVAPGVSVPGSPGASLLQMTFSASSDASGLFGIYAEEGLANTLWTDASFTNQLFTNVPDGTGTVLIGEVQLPVQTGTVPEPSSLALLAFSGATLLAWQLRCNRYRSATSTE